MRNVALWKEKGRRRESCGKDSGLGVPGQTSMRLVNRIKLVSRTEIDLQVNLIIRTSSLYRILRDYED